jgi:hypothetical protein
MAPKVKRQTRKKGMSKISWNGVLYTKKVFLTTMHRENPDVVYWRMKGDTQVRPGKIKKDDLEGWMQFSGAHFV